MASTPFDARWNLLDAAALVRMLVEPMRETGWAVGLGGSTISKGESRKDCDLLLFPLRVSPGTNDAMMASRKTAAREVLEKAGLNLVHDAAVVRSCWRKRGSDDTKHVEIWEHAGRRVDVFFLR